MKKIIILTILLSIIITTACTNTNDTITEYEPDKITIHYFWEQGCPSCEEQKEFLNEIQKKYEDIEIKTYDVKESKNKELLQEFSNAYNERTPAVPTTFIGNEIFIGFTSAVTGTLIEETIKNCQTQKCKNPTELLK